MRGLEKQIFQTVQGICPEASLMDTERSRPKSSRRDSKYTTSASLSRGPRCVRCLSKRRCIREALDGGGTDRAHRTYILIFSGKASGTSVLLSTMHRENSMGIQRSRRWREEEARFRSEPPSWRSWYAMRLTTSAFRVSSL